jgi:hypothetical protein
MIDYYSPSYAVGNCHANDPYSDHYAWLMVLSPEMKFKFEPVKTGIYPSVFLVQPCEFNNRKYFAGLYIYYGNEDSPCYIALYNSLGEILKKNEFEFTTEWESATLLPQSDVNIISVMNGNGIITHYDSDLEVAGTLHIEPVAPGERTIRIDADADGTTEYLFMTKSRDKLLLASEDFSSVATLKLEDKIRIQNYSMKLAKGKPPELFIQDPGFIYVFLYQRNPYFPFKFMLFPVIYAVVFSGISLLSKLQKMRLEQKYKAEKQLLEFQLKSIKNQLDPHFTLNLIASIGDLFDKKDSKTTKYVFSKYSTLLRQSILSADQYAVSLEQELEFVENYLKLEKFRLDDRFDFEITKDGIDSSIMIPKMLVHSFVENALKHGIGYLDKEGRLEVGAYVRDKACIINIKDNGIGRQMSQQKITFSTGKGLSIIDRIIKNYSELKKIRISYRINDLKDKTGNALGTEVIIRVPL